jgi:hypothetical protein
MAYASYHLRICKDRQRMAIEHVRGRGHNKKNYLNDKPPFFIVPTAESVVCNLKGRGGPFQITYRNICDCVPVVSRHGSIDTCFEF